jgi:PAS domain S-box-containing protein
VGSNDEREHRPGTRESPSTGAPGARFAIRVSLGYVVIASIWVIGSSTLLAALVPPGVEATIESVKGLLFVLATGLGLGFLLSRESRRMAAAQQALGNRGRENALLATAVEQSAESVVITDAAGRIEYVNPAFERVTGFSRDEVIGQNPRILKSGEQPASFNAAMWSTLARGSPWVGDFVNRRKDGTRFEEEAVISPILDGSGMITNYVAVKRDVTLDREVEARYDRSRRERTLVAETLARIKGGESPEATADAICRQVVNLTDVVLAAIFIFDLAGRADAIGIGAANGSPPALRPLPYQRSRHLRKRAHMGPWVEEWIRRPWHPYNQYLVEAGVRASAYAPIHHAGEVIGLLIATSTTANAISQLTEYLPALMDFAGLVGALIGPDVADRTEIRRTRARIREIIDTSAFHPLFQPIVDLETGSPVGFEALTRFADGTPPDRLFEEATAVGMGPALEAVTLEAALRVADELRITGWLNVNVSPALILEGTVLRSFLGRVGRPTVLEITEHAEITDYEAFRAAIALLDPGVRLAIDDAGSGYASLAHVVELRPAMVKLDRTLVANVDRDPARQAIVAGMCHFAETARCELVAEGIETAAELETVRRLGIRLGQGYLLGSPTPTGAS